MTLDILDVIRNLYGASGGAAHPSAAAAAIFGLMWREGWANAVAAAERAEQAGGDYDAQNAAFDEAYRETLGWSAEEWHEFWRSGNYRSTEAEAMRFDESWDTFDAFVERMRRGGR